MFWIEILFSNTLNTSENLNLGIQPKVLNDLKEQLKIYLKNIAISNKYDFSNIIFFPYADMMPNSELYSSCFQSLLLTILLQKHAVDALERHLFCFALYSNHILQNNDWLFQEALFGSRLQVFLFENYFLIKLKQEIEASFIKSVWYLFLPII